MNKKVNESPESTSKLSKKAKAVLILIGCLIILGPFVISMMLFVPAAKVLVDMEDNQTAELTIKVTGHQWKWHYEYLDTDIEFFSAPVGSHDQDDASAPQEGGPFKNVNVDNELVIPSGKKIRIIVTSNDVIHSWWVPEFGAKKDAIPGYVNELWFQVMEGKTGIYRGQCAELCGKGHLYMPVVVKVVPSNEFEAWLAAGGNAAKG